LEKEVTPRDMADLIAYLRETLKSASSSMHTLEDVKRAKKSK
jgi:hypothetical protein